MLDFDVFSSIDPKSQDNSFTSKEEEKIQEKEENEVTEYNNLPSFIQNIIDECKDNNSPCPNKKLKISTSINNDSSYLIAKENNQIMNNFNLFIGLNHPLYNLNLSKDDICIYNMPESYLLNVKKSYRLQSYLQENPILYKNNIIECEICFHRIQSYGLLCNCENVFCYDCIKLWRTENTEKNKRETARKCPICGIESNMVIKSKVFLRGEDKKQKFAEFKANALAKNCNTLEKGSIIL